MHVVYLNLAFSNAPSGERLLEAYPTMTRLCESLAAIPGVEVTALQRFDRDEEISRGGVTYAFRSDDPDLLVPGRTTRPTRLFRLAQLARPDVVHFNGFSFQFQLAELRARLPRSTAIVVQHHAGGPKRGLGLSAQRLLLRLADGFLFTADGLAVPWRRSGAIPRGAKVFEVPEASSDFRSVPRKEARRRSGVRGHPAVLWVGRLHEVKDPRTALDGFARAVERLPGARLQMVYDEAPILAELKAFLEPVPAVAERVSLVGKVDHDRLPAFFSAADLFLTSSRDEGSNYALIEALACGALPVASDIPPHRQLTGDGAFGELFAVGDAEGLSAALVRAWDRVHREGDALSAAVRAHFDETLGWGAVAKKALVAYETALASRRRK